MKTEKNVREKKVERTAGKGSQRRNGRERK